MIDGSNLISPHTSTNISERDGNKVETHIEDLDVKKDENVSDQNFENHEQNKADISNIYNDTTEDDHSASEQEMIAPMTDVEMDWMQSLPSGIPEVQAPPPLLPAPPTGAPRRRGLSRPHERQGHEPPGVRVLPKPVTPTCLEREQHELTHIKYETWCRHCVMTREQKDPHRTMRHHNKPVHAQRSVWILAL